MQFDLLTLFPEMFQGVFGAGIVRRAVEAGLISIHTHDLRAHGVGRHRITDDAVYGGGGGMVMKPEPIFDAMEALLETPLPDDLASAMLPSRFREIGVSVILLSPQGRPLSPQVAREMTQQRRLILICGRYEGVDERVRRHLVTDELSIGDYVLSGGEMAAMVVVDVVTRWVPGALGDPGAPFEDSFSEGLLEYPQYTRPPLYRGVAVPEVLLSGNHAEIVRLRRLQSLRRTWQRRPDLLAQARLSPADLEHLREWGQASDAVDEDPPVPEGQ
ncbi:MAG: tRNA (guanosine(37)-N1)-methyltransferase TrmD [Chloroflexi bacterium]|nr:tRNA (guanosine(37)-N1)-methyltransferase TrmD [Chloroflexota bacterium]